MKPKRLLTLGVLLAGVTATASSTVAQEPAPPRTTEQQKVKERLDALESQLKEANAKADRAATEKDRIDKIQQHYEDYYEKVHTTEMHVLEAITAIFALFVGFAALFGFSVFDQRIQNAVSTAITQERANLQKSNAAQMKQLQDDLVSRIADLEKDLKLRSDWQFEFLQGMAAGADKRDDDAADSFRTAVHIYKLGKPRGVLESGAGEVSVCNLFEAFSRSTEKESDRDARAREELKSDLFDGLEDELAQASLRADWLAPLVRERKPTAPASRPPSQFAPSAAPSVKAQSETAAALDTVDHTGPLKVFRNGKQIGHIAPSNAFRCGSQIPSTPHLELLCERHAKALGYDW